MSRPDWIETAEFGRSKSTRVGRPKLAGSPYFGANVESWREITRDLLERQPLSGPSLLAGVMSAWSDIFESRIGPARIGVDLRPTPQIMGFLLHELIPIRLQGHTGWRRESTAAEKDLVYEPDPTFSIEIKTSSNSSGVFGNRSYGVPSDTEGKKAKSGYYCAVNFQGWSASAEPKITRVRYGWIDSTDWIAQAAESGQQSSLAPDVYRHQLVTLYEARSSSVKRPS